MKGAMKGALGAAVLTAFAFAPATSMACEDYDATSAAATPASLVAAAPAAAVSKAPATAVAKALAPNANKQATVKVKASSPEQKLAASNTN